MTRLKTLYDTIIKSAHKTPKGVELSMTLKELKEILGELVKECIKAGKKLK